MNIKINSVIIRNCFNELFKEHLRGSLEGVAMLEFAIVALPYFMLIFGMLEIGLIMLFFSSVDTAADSVVIAVREMSFRGSMKNITPSRLKRVACDAMSVGSCDLLNVDLLSPQKANYYINKAVSGVNDVSNSPVLVIRVGIIWPFNLMTSPLLVPKVGGVRMITAAKTVSLKNVYNR